MCARVCYTGQLLTNLVLKVMNTTNYMLLYIYQGMRYFLSNEKCKSTLTLVIRLVDFSEHMDYLINIIM